jgi:hypothetical protein
VPVPSSVRERIKPLLAPGDEIRYLFPASHFPSPTVKKIAHVIVVVSRTAITVVYSGYFSRNKPKSVLASYPRNTRIGPVDTSLTPSFWLKGLFYEVDDEYVAVVNAADAELAEGGALPPDPLPDL